MLVTRMKAGVVKLDEAQSFSALARSRPYLGSRENAHGKHEDPTQHCAFFGAREREEPLAYHKGNRPERR